MTAQALWKELQAEFKKKNKSKCVELCGKLKLEFAKNRNLLLISGNNSDLKTEMEVHELACYIAIENGDLDQFENEVRQLNVFYRDYKLTSNNEGKITGLYLLHLLASDRIGEFHSDLELLAAKDFDKSHVQTSVQIERYLMEGNYAKISAALNKLQTQEYYPMFLNNTLKLVRKKVMKSLQVSAEGVNVSFAMKMLYFKSQQELKTFVDSLEQESSMDDTASCRWEIKNDKLVFSDPEGLRKEALVPTYEVISNTIGYATDLERIV